MSAAASGGLGLSQFLKHGSESGGSGAWLRQWKKDGVGEVTIWLHTRAPIVPSFSHPFLIEDEYEDKETGRMAPVMRYPRFVSPDAEVVHRNQYFRNDDDTMQVVPDRDPFLLLREWLRFADHIGLDDAIFRWNDEKNRKTIIYDRGTLSGKVKRGKSNFGSSLDTKAEYIYVVVDNDNIANGPQLDREGKLVSQKIVEVIKHQQKTFGEEEGDPMLHPYAFYLTAEKTASPMNSYKAYKAERAQFTDEVWEQIGSIEFPDPLPFGRPSEGDPEKIRDAMVAAMQVDLPIDQLFSDDPDVRKALTKPADVNRAAARASKASQAKTSAQQPPVPGRSAKPEAGAQAGAKPAPAGASVTSPATAPAEAPKAGPQPRRKKAAAVEPEPPPSVETAPCEDCGATMLVTDTKCPSCGVEYEIDEMPPQAPPPSSAKPSSAGQKPAAAGQKSTTAGPKPGGAKAAAGPKPSAAQQSLPETDEPADGQQANCWSCAAELGGLTVCPACGIDQGDDLPF